MTKPDPKDRGKEYLSRIQPGYASLPGADQRIPDDVMEQIAQSAGRRNTAAEAQIAMYDETKRRNELLAEQNTMLAKQNRAIWWQWAIMLVVTAASVVVGIGQLVG